MLSYLWSNVLALASEPMERPWHVVILAGIWHELQRRYSGFPFSDAVVLVTLCWTANYLLGSMRACYYSLTRGPREKRWQPGRSAKGIGRWVLWMLALFIAYALRSSGRFAFDGFATFLESAIILTEATRVYRKIGEISGSMWMEKAAAAGQDGVDQLAEQAQEAVKQMVGAQAQKGKQDEALS